MEKKVIFRDRQELQSADLNNIQDFTDETLQDIITDALTNQTLYVGLAVTAKSATEVTVDVGRLWVGSEGKIYDLASAQDISLLTYLPLQDKKYILITAIGQETETDIQPRDFLVDVQTGQTEPQSVAMEKDRTVVLSVVSGQESPDPQVPATPTGYLEIARILLDASGIVSITQNQNAKLPRLTDTEAKVKNIETWKNLAEPRISTLASDISSLAKKLNEMGRNNLVVEIAADVARLKELANLPDTYADYGADHFLDEEESDTGNVDYYARVEEGIRFPWAGQAQAQPDLFNPYETAVKQYSGFIIPDFTEEVRVKTEGYAGEISIAQYQDQPFTLKQGSMAVIQRRYGPTRTVCTNARHYTGSPEKYLKNILGIDAEVLDVYGFHGGTYWIRYRQYWEDEIRVPYHYYAPTTQQINGSQIAQTFLNSQHGWLTKVGLFFTEKATDGIVYLALCETEKGVPNPEKTIAITQVDPGNIKLYPEETVFTFPRPVFLEAGKRYAFLLITAGDHKVATVTGKEYTEGTLFYSMDGEYYRGDFTKDLMLKLYYCNFKSTYVTVELESISLSDGIADIDVKLNAIKPENTDLIIEYQYNGKWYAIAPDTAENLIGLPAMLPLRVKFIGSTALMPAIDFVGSLVKVARPATSFVHISTTRSLPAASSNIEVQVLLENFDSAKHTCTIKLIDVDTSTTYNADVVEDKYDPDGTRRVATFNTIPAIQNYKIRIEGTTTNALETFHVAERIDIAF